MTKFKVQNCFLVPDIETSCVDARPETNAEANSENAETKPPANSERENLLELLKKCVVSQCFPLKVYTPVNTRFKSYSVNGSGNGSVNFLYNLRDFLSVKSPY